MAYRNGNREQMMYYHQALRNMLAKVILFESMMHL